jgi:hypothetical protein
MQLIHDDRTLDLFQPSSSGRTSQESSTPRTTPLDAFLERLPAKMSRSSRQGVDGRTLVVCMVPKEQSRGGSLTPNTSEWPNDADVCSLSQVLETTSIPQRFFLSPRACAGILRRAEKRGKVLPPALAQALTQMAYSEQWLGALCADTHPACIQRTRCIHRAFNSANCGIGAIDCRIGAQPISFGGQMSVPQTDVDLVQTLQAKNPMAVAYNISPGKGELKDDIHVTYAHVSKTIDASNSNPAMHQGGAAIVQTMAVRRLTPVECERLQGFPDGYTNIPWRKKPESPDGPRYKALGNSWAVPVVAWIGKRIQEAVQ